MSALHFSASSRVCGSFFAATTAGVLVVGLTLSACTETPERRQENPKSSSRVRLTAPESATVGTEARFEVRVSGIEVALVEIIDQQLGQDLLIGSARPTAEGYEATWTPTVDDEGPYTLRAKVLSPAGTTTLSEPHALEVLPAGDSTTVLAARQSEKPTGLTAVATRGKVTLGWNPVRRASGYRVYRSVTDGFTASTGNRLGEASEARYEDTTAQDDTTYYYRVTSYRANARNNQTRESEPSDQASAQLGDLQPPTVSITSPSGDKTYTNAQPITIEIAAADNVGVARVELYDGSELRRAMTRPPYQHLWAITGADNGKHQWTAKAFDAAGNQATSTARQLTVSIQDAGDTTPPTVSITQPAPDTTYDSAQEVSLEAEAQDDKGVAKVEFYNNSALQGTATSAPFKHTWSLTAAENGTHQWTARAFDAAGNSAVSPARTLTVQIPVAPVTPGGVVAVGGTGQVTVSWAAAANATSYNIYWATTAGVTPTSGQKIAQVTSPHVHDGLVGGIKYHYVVTAINATGESDPSIEVSATPTGEPVDPDGGTPEPDAGPPDPDVGTPADSAPGVLVTFAPSSEDFANPERGFMKQSSVWPDEPFSDSKIRRKQPSDSVVWVYFRLDNYRDPRDGVGVTLPDYTCVPIDGGGLANVALTFQTAREKGIKLVYRFIYNWGPDWTPDPDKANPDVPIECAKLHLQQLEPIMVANADVTVAVQAGMVGHWGEWHSSKYLHQHRQEIVETLLSILPDDRMVMVRYPRYKELFYGAPLTDAEAFTKTKKARVGHHNDCFLRDQDDTTYRSSSAQLPKQTSTYCGTQDPITCWKSFVAAEGRFTPIGGETCQYNPPRSDCANALVELQTLHWSFINNGYRPEVLDSWAAGGCMDTIRRKLGYRLALVDALIPQKISVGGNLAVELTLKNEGFASMFNPRPVYLVLSNATSRHEIAIPSIDPRRWESTKQYTETLSAPLPAGVTPGVYQLSLWLPDAASAIRDDPSFAVRFANAGVWDSTTGLNVLSANLEVTP